MKKPIATAFRISLILDRVKDEEMRAKIQFDINHAERYGVIYLASYLPQIKVIEELGFRFKKKKYKNIETVYYVFPFFEYLAREDER